MRESIEIRNFGPINSIKIDDIKPFTVFVGESGCGKSTIMKILAMMRWIYKMVGIRSYLKDYSGVKKSPFRFTFPSYLKQDGLNEYVKPDTYIYYKRGVCEILFDNTLPKKKFKVIQERIPREELNLEKISFISEKRGFIPDILNHNLSINKKAFYLNEVWNDYILATESISDLDMPFINVAYRKKKTKQGERHLLQSIDDENVYSVDISEVSSGMQSVTPLSLIIDYYSQHYDLVKSMNRSVLSFLSEQDSLKDFRGGMNVGDIPNRRVSVFIEEPELSLYPDNQVGLMDYIVGRCFNRRSDEYEISLMLSTHSPYIVSYLNVLLARTDGVGKPYLSAPTLSVYRVYDGGIQDLMMYGSVTPVVDTRDLSETMRRIYEEYKRHKKAAQ